MFIRLCKEYLLHFNSRNTICVINIVQYESLYHYEVMKQKVSLPIMIECKDWRFFLVLQLETQLGGENMIFSSNLLSVRCSSFEDFVSFFSAIISVHNVRV